MKNKRKIAETIENLLDSVSMQQITDRRKPVDNLVEEVKQEWAYNMFDRKPAPAYIRNGIIHPTDLDLASIMSALADRNAVINIPEYASRRAKVQREGEWVVSDKNRHGKLVGLGANREVFSFSARIIDQNVINTDTNEAGAYRNFLLTDLDGGLYSGWGRIEMHPTAKENRFYNGKKLNIGNTIFVKNFVTPQLWGSFFGEPYAKLKALETRLNDEAGFYRKVALQLKDNLKTLSKKRYVAPVWESRGPETKVGKSIPVTVQAFEVEMDLPLHNEYKEVPFSRDGYLMAKARANELTYAILPRLRFNSRAVELAYSKYANGGFAKPSWATPDIEEGYVVPGKRTEWNRMNLDDKVALRFRAYDKTERINPRPVF